MINYKLVTIHHARLKVFVEKNLMNLQGFRHRQYLELASNKELGLSHRTQKGMEFGKDPGIVRVAWRTHDDNSRCAVQNLPFVCQGCPSQLGLRST